MKKQFWFPNYEYCFMCGLPQGKYLSSAHPEFVTGQKMICPLEDFVAVLTWFVFMDPPTYKKACSAFTALRAGMMVEEFTKWAKIKADGHSFYNALELVIWLWTQKQR